MVLWGEREGKSAASVGNLGNFHACSMPLELPDSITAVDFAPIKVGNE